MTKIPWTDESWNPVTGCTPVSEGCAHCYAEKMSRRFAPFTFSKVTLHPDRLDIPLRWRKPRMVFVPSMGDLFHKDVPTDFVRWVFRVMEYSPRHTFQVLTKRPERALRDWKEYLLYPPLEGTAIRFKGDAMAQFAAGHKVEWNCGYRWPPNVWLGVSVENQARADERIPLLLDTPAAVRFVSAEPLLGPLDLAHIHDHEHEIAFDSLAGRRWTSPRHEGGEPWPRLDWVIVGGESGGPPERRLVYKEVCHDDEQRTFYRPKPEALQWVRSIRDQCQVAGVPFFWKQWGPRAGQGTLLDGREHKEMPA